MRWMVPVLVWGLVGATGCASVIKGSHGQVEIRSRPAGATILLDGKERGITPATLTLRNGGQYQVVLQHEGYHPHYETVTSSFSGHSLWFFILYSLIFDAIAGNITTIDQELIDVSLRPKPGAAPPAPTVASPQRLPEPAAGPEPPVPAGPELKVVVLDFLNNAQLSAYELDSVSDLVRVAALGLPGDRLFVYTRENLLELLPPGTDLSKCEGSCEVETGRNVGADFVVTGAAGLFGGRLQVKLNLHSTRTGRLVGGEVVSAPDIASLEPLLTAAGKRLLRGALERTAQAPAAKAPATDPDS